VLPQLAHSDSLTGGFAGSGAGVLRAECSIPKDERIRIGRGRRDEQPRFGKLGGIRQWIESINDTLKGQFSLEDHGGHTIEGVWVRICQRLLTLAAGCWHNWLLWETGAIDAPGRHFTPYDH
jgi:hypothetical protein